LQECFASLGHRAGDFPVSEACARDSLALPIYAELTEAQQRYVVDEIVSFLGA
jgi:dTDP-4-amino-4,6-dideoxygalactose transaminase